MLKKKDQVLLDTLIIAIVILNSPAKKRKGNKISFLDISISRNNNALETSIFCKPLRYSDKDATTIRKHYHSLCHWASIDNFSILGNAMNNNHLSLKKSLSIPKLKPSLNAAKE